MAKTSYLSIDPGIEAKYFGTLQSGDKFTFPRIRPKTTLLSQVKIKNLTGRSFLKQCRDVWITFTPTEQAAWKAADPRNRKNGWQWYVMDKVQRLKLGLSGEITPSSLHNGLVGLLQVASPATALKIIQPHPAAYYIKHKVTGTKSQYEPVFVQEPFALPLTIGLSYKADLVSTGAGAYARFYALFWRNYQGNNLEDDITINLNLSQAWTHTQATKSSSIGECISYNLFFDFHNVRGTVLIDQLETLHDGSNWARDPYCVNLAESFTRAYYQVPAHWAPITLPDGAGFESIYPT